MNIVYSMIAIAVLAFVGHFAIEGWLDWLED